MLINEVCKKCSLTKKAVEYYVEQGLVAPAMLENGYRDFSDAEADRLKEISVLRGLGLSVADIHRVLSGQGAPLNEISGQKCMEINLLQEKQQLIQELAKTQDYEAVQEALQNLQKKQSVLERLRNAFPGYYGNYACQHFAQFLGEPVQTAEQQEAFDTILDFLDNVYLELPDDLREFYDEVTADVDNAVLGKVSSDMQIAVNDIDRFINENRETMEDYMAFTQTEEYKSTQAYRLSESLKQFNSASGYDDIFIPAVCRLSKSYREYHEALQRANKRFLELYPNAGGQK